MFRNKYLRLPKCESGRRADATRYKICANAEKPRSRDNSYKTRDHKRDLERRGGAEENRDRFRKPGKQSLGRVREQTVSPHPSALVLSPPGPHLPASRSAPIRAPQRGAQGGGAANHTNGLTPPPPLSSLPCRKVKYEYPSNQYSEYIAARRVCFFR